MNDYIKQHYIPQFIIKNFCKTDKKTYFFDVSNKSITQKFPNDIFEEKYLYEYSQDKKESINKHLVLFECGDKLEFVLGDAYPIALGQKIHPLDIFNRMSLVSLIFPISYNRAIGLIDTYDEFHSMFRHSKINNKDWYDEPKKFGTGMLIELKYLNDEDVAYINKSILKNSREGVCFRSERKCGLEFI